MRTKIYLVTLLIAFVTIFGLTACMNEDEPKDITKEVTMYVSSETGIMYDLFDSEGEFPIECMLVKEQGEDEYRPLAFCGIQGFEYEKGYEYDLRVNKTPLENPPAATQPVHCGTPVCPGTVPALCIPAHRLCPPGSGPGQAGFCGWDGRCETAPPPHINLRWHSQYPSTIRCCRPAAPDR